MSAVPGSDGPRVDPIFCSGDLAPAALAVLAARFSDERCDCAEPYNPGPKATVCLVCCRVSEALERRAVQYITAAHEFEPRERHPEMCDRCSGWTDDPRHHGVDGLGARYQHRTDRA